MHARIATATLAVAMGFCAPAIAPAQSLAESQLPAFSPDRATAGPGTNRSEACTPDATPAVQTGADDDDMKFAVYPVLLGGPRSLPPQTSPDFPDFPNGPDLPGGSGSTDASFDGAALAGFSMEKANWRIDVDGIWAAWETQRDRPLLNVDLEIIYGHVSGGVKIYKDLYVTGGVRRLALKYDIQVADRPAHFVREPGIWDPLVGLAWHGALGSRWALHLTGEGGGFGAVRGHGSLRRHPSGRKGGRTGRADLWIHRAVPEAQQHRAPTDLRHQADTAGARGWPGTLLLTVSRPDRKETQL